MMRTSYSPMFNEALDFSCVVFDGKAEMVAQAPFVPAQIGSTVHVVPTAIAEIGEENLEPGDVVFTNDPYRSNCHLPEFVVVKPYFHEGRVLAYTANIAHMTDVGGMVPAAFGDHQNIFQEGIRFPPVKIYERDREVESIFKILISNVRTPKHSYGDMKAMIGSLYLAERRIAELVERYGAETFVQCCEDVKDVSERLMRAEIATWPDGEYSAEGLLEDDGVVPDRPWKISGDARDPRRRADRRLHRLRPAVLRPGQPDVRHDGLGRLQRRAAHGPLATSRTTTAATGRSR